MWTKVPIEITEFNSCRETTIVWAQEYGLFHRRYSFEPLWSLYHRPVDGSNCWTGGMPFKTKRELLAWFDENIVKKS